MQKSREKVALLLFCLGLFGTAAVSLAQEKESYEEKLRKYREDSLRAVEANRKKLMEKERFDKQNAVKIAYNEGLKFMRLRQDERAIQSFDKAISIEIDGVDDTKAKAYYVKAFCQKRLRRYNDAIESYKKAIELDADYAEAYHGLGTTLEAIGEAEAAIEAFTQAVRANPSYDKSYYEMGRVYLDKKKEFDKAVESFKKATEVNPKHDNAFTAMGDAYMKQGNTREAITALESAVAINPKNYLANFHLAAAYNQSGNPLKALEAAKRSLQARANFAPAAFEAGMALKNLKRYDEAKEYFTLAAKDRQWRKNAQYEIELINDEIKRGRN